jgi:hypothetical protein
MSQYSISVPPSQQDRVAEGLENLEKFTELGRSELFRLAATANVYSLEQLQQFTSKETLKTSPHRYIVIVV